MRVLFDTNVLLDVLLRRTPFLAAAVYLVDRVEEEQLTGLLTPTALTTIFYVGRKKPGRLSALRFIERLLSRFEVAPVGRSVLKDALDLDFGDFEDGVMHEAARHARAEALVTRNEKDFAGARLPVYRPEALVRLLRAQERGE